MTNLSLSILDEGLATTSSGYDQVAVTMLTRNLVNSATLQSQSFLETPGVYILADSQPDDDGNQKCFVGKSGKSGLAKRMEKLMRSPKPSIPNWNSAFLVHSHADSIQNLSEDEVAAFQHIIYEMLQNKNKVVVVNAQLPPGDPEISLSRHRAIEKECETVGKILGGLGVGGKATSLRAKKSVEEKTARKYSRPKGSKYKKRKSNKQTGIRTETLRDLLDSSLLAVGDILLSSDMYRAKAEIISNDGKIKLLESKGKPCKETLIFNSPSSASRIPCEPSSQANGWTFWTVERTGETLASLRRQHRRLHKN